MSSQKLSFSGSRVSNSELFVWALYLLGGADRDVDVEEIYLKCFEIAPARLSWRTRSDLPDYKKTAKALQSVEADTDFIQRPHKYARRLTKNGIEWVEANYKQLEKHYGRENVPPPETNRYLQHSRQIKGHPVWEHFQNKNFENVLHLVADALECSPASPENIWQSRFADLERISKLLNDDEMRNFTEYARTIHRKGVDHVQ